ncbi:30S ribosomal protein S16 [Candidatus Nomurabacteria bacterium]|nr:30S ribosomal protein S16 [Candidatus Nomurabacteria bacterium]USN94820.1 MAG: 30S ribosomal protein S16 [Candidatus Nomurabacteria bacterium]
MLTIRMQRTGRKNQPFFKIVLTDSKRAPKSGKFIDSLGYYNPKSGEVVLKGDEIKRRIKEGAKTSETVHNFLVKEGLIDSKKVNNLPKKAPTKKRKELKQS